jgi:hypothetical protein
MSQRQRDVLKIMSAVLRGERTQAEAARLLRKSERQVRRLQRRLETEGDAGVVHRVKGRASNRQLSQDLRVEAFGSLPVRVVTIIDDGRIKIIDGPYHSCTKFGGVWYVDGGDCGVRHTARYRHGSLPEDRSVPLLWMMGKRGRD